MFRNSLFIISSLAIISLSACRGDDTEDLDSPDLTTQQAQEILGQTESQAEDYLQEKQITLPDNASKHYLSSPTDSTNTGVVVLQDDSQLTIIASLPDSTETYSAWVLVGGKTIKLGNLRIAKGGYLLDVSYDSQLQVGTKVIITTESSPDNSMPSENIVLETEI